MPYYETGFLYSFRGTEIPWVTDGDAGTEFNNPKMPVPNGALTLEEYLRIRTVRSARDELSNRKGEILPLDTYSETVINLGTMLPIAIFDFRATASNPSVILKVISRDRYKARVNDAEDSLESKKMGISISRSWHYIYYKIK